MTDPVLPTLWDGYRRDGHWSGLRLHELAEWAVVTNPRLKVSTIDATAPLGELLERGEQESRRLAGSGIAAGTRVFMEVTRPLEDITSLLALSRLDAVVFFSPPGLSPSETARMIERAGAGVVVRPGETVRVDPPPTGEPAWIAEPTRYVTFTSGTTGEPKGIQHSADTLAYAGLWAVAYAEPRPGAVLAMISIAHAAGIAFSLLSSLMHARDLVLYHGKWSPQRALDLVESHGGSYALGTPTHLLDLVAERRRRGGSGPHLTMSVGGAPVHAELVEAADAVGITACRIFGLSECLGHTSTRGSDPLGLRMRTEGQSFPGTSDVTLDASGRQMGRGSVGEAACRGPSMFLGYLGEPVLGDRLTADGHFRTGDRIQLDDDGRVTVLGRFKDIIIRGGENVDPLEVESLLSRMPGVAAAAVVGVPDTRLGERLAAALEVEPDAVVTAEAILARFADDGVPKFKWPEYWHMSDRLPRTPVGKVDRKQIRQLVRSPENAPVHPDPS